MFGNHGLCGLLEEGAHEKSPKCLGGNLGDFFGRGGDFVKVSICENNIVLATLSLFEIHYLFNQKLTGKTKGAVLDIQNTPSFST